MAKNKYTVFMTSYGVYTQWDERNKQLPKLIEVTTDIPARESIEFGFVVNIKKAKGIKLQYVINHPDILGEDGIAMAPFTGDVYVSNNNWDFYLGDTLWLPLENKLGHWNMRLEHDGNLLAEKTFVVDIEFKGERNLGEAAKSFKIKKRW